MVEQTIDLNTADAEELTRLPGIGPVLAQRIVSYRETAGPYVEPADITSVSGIGERSYGAIADRVSAAGRAEETSPMAGHGADDVEDRAALEKEAVGEESRVGSASLEEETEEGPTEGAADAIPPEEPGRGQEGRGEEGAAEAAGDSTEDGGPGADLSPSPLSRESEVAEPTKERRSLSWLWIAVAGGLLGMVFALIAFAGINGSLDVGHSRAVLGIEADVGALTRDLDALSADVEGLGRRIEALEGLKTRMDNVESSVDELGARTDALEVDVDALDRELEAIAEDVAALQQEAERTRSFFQGLQGLLDDVFGAAEAESSPTATPEGK